MDSFGETTVIAMFYMYFVALSGSLGVLTAALIGFKFYNKKIAGGTAAKRGRRG